MLKGNIPEVFWPNVLALYLMMTAAVFTAAKRFRQTLN
jgi:hypothetical protein